MAIPGDFYEEDEQPTEVARLAQLLPDDSDPKSFVLCMTSDRIPPLPSVERTCGGCPTVVWVSHTLLSLVDHDGAVPMCPQCAIDRATDPDSDIEYRVAPQQTDDLAALGVLGAADQFVTVMNRLERGKAAGDSDAPAEITQVLRTITEPDQRPRRHGTALVCPRCGIDHGDG